MRKRLEKQGESEWKRKLKAKVLRIKKNKKKTIVNWKEKDCSKTDRRKGDSKKGKRR
jgi:hypothetical protein